MGKKLELYRKFSAERMEIIDLRFTVVQINNPAQVYPSRLLPAIGTGP